MEEGLRYATRQEKAEEFLWVFGVESGPLGYMKNAIH
jgi:hypothetical protein